MKCEYNTNTVKFLENWNLTPEINEKLLKKIAAGELTEILIGCDTEFRKIRHCGHDRKYSGPTELFSFCRICEEILTQRRAYHVYTGDRIEHFVESDGLQEELKKNESAHEKRWNEKHQKQQKEDEISQGLIAQIKRADEQIKSFGNATTDARKDKMITYWTEIKAKATAEYKERMNIPANYGKCDKCSTWAPLEDGVSCMNCYTE